MNPQRRLHLWVTVFLLLFAFGIRAHAVQALPAFTDESQHIRRAEKIYTFQDRNLNLTLGKLLSYYWIGAFQPERIDALWVGRTVSGLFALLGLAATYAVARRLFNRPADLIALTLATFSPFMIFFDRLALTDPLTAASGMLVVWGSMILAKHPIHRVWHWLNGFLICLVVVAKLLGLPFLIMPLAAVIFLNPAPLHEWKQLRPWLKTQWQRYRRALLTVYGIFALMLLIFTVHVVERYLADQPVGVVNNNLINVAAEDKKPTEVIADNLEKLWQDNWILHSPPLWLLMLLVSGLLLWQNPRKTLYLLSAIIFPWGFSVLFAAEMSTRYLTISVLPAFVLVAGGIMLVEKWIVQFHISQTAYRVVTVAGIGVWLLTFAAPFIYYSWNDPTQLNLPKRDRWEYFTNFSSGYGLIDAVPYLQTLPPSPKTNQIEVLSLAGSCHLMRLYMQEPSPLNLRCLPINWTRQDIPASMADIQTIIDERLSQAEWVYLMIEPDLPYVDLSYLDQTSWQFDRRFTRPMDGMVIEVYRLDTPTLAKE